MANEINSRDNLYIYFSKNKDYLSVRLDKDNEDVNFLAFQDKEKTFIIKFAVSTSFIDRVNKSSKSEITAIWEEIDKMAGKVLVNQI